MSFRKPVYFRKALALLVPIVAALLLVVLKHAVHLRVAVFLLIAGVVVFLVSIATAMTVSRVTLREVVWYLRGGGSAGPQVPAGPVGM